MTNTQHEDDGIHLSLATLVLVIMVIIYLISGPVLRKKNIQFIRASGFTMIAGVLLTLIVKFFSPSSNFVKGFKFNDVFFFTFVLPWVIFNVGYNQKIENFFKYLRFIFIYSIIGTIITFILISFITYILNAHGFFCLSHNDASLMNNNNNNNNTNTTTTSSSNYILNFSLLEILQFAAAISASDPVTAVSLLMNNDEEKLKAITLGDSVINNAVVIGFYNIVKSLNKQEKEFSFNVAFELLYKCIYLFITSFIVGAIVGMISAYFFKRMERFNMNRVQQISLLLLFAFISYTICDYLQYSALIGLLSTALFMSHYTFFNLSFLTREESTVITMVLNYLAEAFAFSLIGMTIVDYSTRAYSIRFVLIELMLIVLTRGLSIFAVTFVFQKLFVGEYHIKLSQQSILTVIGCIRGVVSFGLGISVETTNQIHNEVLESSVIYILLITNVVFIAVLPMFREKIKSIDDSEETHMKSNLMLISDNMLKEEEKEDKECNRILKEEDMFYFLHPNTNSGGIDAGVDGKGESLTKRLMVFDNKNIVPFFVNNWPDVKDDNENLAKLIQRALKDWNDKRKQINQSNDNDNNLQIPNHTKVEMDILSPIEKDTY